MSSPIDEIERIVEDARDADDVLRRVVDALVEHDGVEWAAVSFLENGTLAAGPEAGTPHDEARLRRPISFNGDPVGELQVDGTVDPALLGVVAERIAPFVLIGWDTGGESWDP